MSVDPVFLAVLVASSPAHRAAALEYARQGYAVVPCHVMTSAGCTCGRHDAPTPPVYPLVPIERATSDEEQVRSWWTIWGGAAVGIVVDGQLQRVLADPDVAHRPAPAAPVRSRGQTVTVVWARQS